MEYSIIDVSEQEQDGQKLSLTINSSRDDLFQYLNLIEAERKKQLPDFSKLERFCFELFSRLPLPVSVLKEDRFILRCRPNYNGEVFNNKAEISYNSACPNFGRFNLVNDPVFYAAIPTKSGDGGLTTICESCKELFDVANIQETQYFTIGKWNVRKPINVIILTFYNEAYNQSEDVRFINPKFIEFIYNSCTKDDFEKCFAIYSYFSTLAAEKNNSANDYLVTTAFFHSLKKIYGNNLGIVYSSSMTDNNGLNIVLTKELVDEGHVSLEGALMYKSMRDRKNLKSYTLPFCSNYALADKSGTFLFTSIL